MRRRADFESRDERGAANFEAEYGDFDDEDYVYRPVLPRDEA